MPPEITRLTTVEIALLAGRGLYRVDNQGLRGTTLCSQAEIEAMAAALAFFGVVPVKPNAAPPDGLLLPFENHLKGGQQ